jgi:hypothetical protein
MSHPVRWVSWWREAAAALAKIDVLKADQKEVEKSIARTVKVLDEEVGDVLEKDLFLETASSLMSPKHGPKSWALCEKQK